MKLEVLVSTMMNNSIEDLLKKMNIQSDAIIINQCDENKVETINHGTNKIKMYSFKERGVGLSRNNALMRASSDICLFADDDVTYVDNYEKMIIDEFKRHPDADMIIFNILSHTQDRPEYVNTKTNRLKWYKSLKYPAFRIAIRTESQRKENIFFSLLFGGGARYSCGEDSKFISDFFKRKMKVYVSKEIIGEVVHNDSTWFHGYTDRYFIDKGVLFSSLGGKLAIPLCFQYIIRHYKSFNSDKSRTELLKLMLQGTNLMK